MVWNAISVTVTHCFNGHFPGSWLSPPLIVTSKGCWCEYFYRQDALPLTQPTVSEHWRTSGHKFLQVTGCPACCLTNGDNALKAVLLCWSNIVVCSWLYCSSVACDVYCCHVFCRHLNGCLLDAISRPHLLITDAFNADYVQARRMQRDEQLLSKFKIMFH